MPCPRVLSVQSSVVSGYVGNKSATLPLQLHGFDVDPINSVQFSNHTGYGTFTGQKLSGDELATLLRGLEANGLLRYDYVLSGYIGNESCLRQLVGIVQRIKELNPEMKFFCDPVMGDGGKLYVPEAFVSIYREMLLPLAYVVFPNQTEIDCRIASPLDAMRACLELHQLGVVNVVITSVDFSSGSDKIHVFASSKAQKQWTYSWHSCIKYPEYFSGTGDLFSALFLAWYHKTNDLNRSIVSTLGSVMSVLEKTFAAKSNELLLIQSRFDLLESSAPIASHTSVEVDQFIKDHL